MPLSLEKCIVLHCGSNQPFNAYTIDDRPMASINLFKDLSVIHCADNSHTELCKAVYAKACRMAGAVRRIFQSKAPELIWPAYQSYVLLKLYNLGLNA